MISSLNKYWRAAIYVIGGFALFVTGDVTQASSFFISAITGLGA